MNMIGMVIDSSWLFFFDIEVEFCFDFYFVVKWSECFVDLFFVGVRVINFCCIEKSDIFVVCLVN